MDRILLSLILFLVQCYMFCVVKATISNITSDQSALLAVKARISYEPHNQLRSNWSTSTSVCSWIGVTCGSKHRRVIALNLSYMGLAGIIPPHIGNLSFLVSLSVSNNSFHGYAPNELARLYRLKYLNLQFNNFNGEIPSSLGLLSRLKFMSLNGNNFIGTIPASLCNITSLQEIYFYDNMLSGFIPPCILNKSSMQNIDLGGNRLSGPMPSVFFDLPSLEMIQLDTNNLSGGLPIDMFHHLPNLQVFDVSINKLYGKVPSTLFKYCKQLSWLGLWDNNFEGRLPPEIGNLTMLTNLVLGQNNFEGAIPREIGNLQNLEIFSIDSNGFSGPIPYEIFNISTVQGISMTFNKFSGQLPSNMGLFLPNLQQLFLGANQLSGTVPSSTSNASMLTFLDLASNSFSGFIPKTIGNLRLLQVLNLNDNHLITEPSLFSYLSNCKYLSFLALSNNTLNFVLPIFIGNLSLSLQQFTLQDCGIRGIIPPNIGNLSNLILLALDQNQLAGPIPRTIGRLRKLQGLSLSGNKLEGPIHSDFCRLKSLSRLYAVSNKLYGQVPECISNLTMLRALHLGFNQLSSMVPLSLWSLTDLLVVNLTSNFLSGSLSSGIGDMKVLTELDLSRNQLSGHIPTTIGGLLQLIRLSLADNRLESSIPDSFRKMVGLEYLDLSNNELYGEIPKSLEALLYLRFLNLSFNKLRGQIPIGGPFVHFSATSFISNDALCGAPRLQVPPCQKSPRPKGATKVRILEYVLPTIGLLILVVSGLIFWTKCRKRNTKLVSEVDLSPLATWRRVSRQELLRATEGFSPNNLIGKGSFGSVYKGTLSDATNIAIKVLNLQVEGAFRSFDAECEVLRNIRHRNLVKFISACSNMDFKAFVLEYMPNGNLEMWLYSDNQFLNLLQRLNIMIDVAAALEYLHFGNTTPIIHCDLKPSNVLLDEDMVAHVADFGIAKLLGNGDSLTRTMTLATIGYMAPEYGWEGIVSTRGDVYSYGILLMETFTRKRPTDNMFTGGMSLKYWVEESFPISVIEVSDPNLLSSESGYAATAECLSSILGLALGCCANLPEERINMKNVFVRLNKVKLKYLQDIAGGDVSV